MQGGSKCCTSYRDPGQHGTIMEFRTGTDNEGQVMSTAESIAHLCKFWYSVPRFKRMWYMTFQEDVLYK